VVGTRRIIADLEQQREAKLEERRRRQQESGQTAQTPAVDRNPVYQQLKVSLADAEAKVAGLRARLGDAQARYAALQSTARLRPQLEEELAQLNRDYLVHKANYEGLVARRESALLTGELDQSAGVADFRIIDPPRVSPQPVAPDRRMLLGLVLALSLGGGVIASLVASQMLPTFSSAKSLQQVTERPVLGWCRSRPRRPRCVPGASATMSSPARWAGCSPSTGRHCCCCGCPRAGRGNSP
jgi:uncharacterized protein involved in exopolysaccharide biosynthesis